MIVGLPWQTLGIIARERNTFLFCLSYYQIAATRDKTITNNFKMSDHYVDKD